MDLAITSNRLRLGKSTTEPNNDIWLYLRCDKVQKLCITEIGHGDPLLDGDVSGGGNQM
jgi:hypothetical protein